MEKGAQISAIELQGIVRNRTKIGVEDGMAEDILNLRFKDGSWRTSGNGREVYTDNVCYSQLYIHTNVYRHLLGVNDNKLWWFADIATDGVTFTAKSTPVELTSVSGDLWITQNGHLLTIIDGEENFEYFVFKTSNDEYVQVKVDENGEQTDRGLYPFGQVHFNCHTPFDAEHYHYAYDVQESGSDTLYYQIKNYDVLKEKLKKKNQFGQPFLVIAAIKLYDGSYIYTTPPAYLHPRENMNFARKDSLGVSLPSQYLFESVQDAEEHFNVSPIVARNVIYRNGATYEVTRNTNLEFVSVETEDITFLPYVPQENLWSVDPTTHELAFSSSYDGDEQQCIGAFINYVYAGGTTSGGFSSATAYFALGSDLIVNIDRRLLDAFNSSDVFSSLCIFVTREADIFTKDDDGNLEIENAIDAVSFEENWYTGTTSYRNITHRWRTAKLRDIAKVRYDLLNSPFYLLREYDKNSLSTLLENPIVDLTTPEYDGLLMNLVQSDRLSIESSARTTYLPRYTYMYNGRLHIADYKAEQFHGYPLDLFHLHNHSLKLKEDEYFKHVLPELVSNNDEYVQYERTDRNFPTSYPTGTNYFAYVEVKIPTDDGTQTMVRYIAPYEIDTPVNGRADYIESLNPLLTFPDGRATEMTIKIYNSSLPNYVYTKTFALKSHPLYNYAYYFDEDLKPIVLNRYDDNTQVLPDEENTTSYFPNGLKVSKTDNPMFFPVENTHSIGSSRIVAMCANTEPVSTGQQGDAPLMVFCEDGIYGLYVDASGHMAYPNARPSAPDVCNNPKSVTPIDGGIVFSTDRGLMMIVGKPVEELGAPAEGDVLQYANANSKDYMQYAAIALTNIAGFGLDINDNTDFLTYLRNARINYNHNERELMVSNPDKEYSYIMDRDGNWSRRDYTAVQYVNNYPTSYRVAAVTVNDNTCYKYFKVDEEGDSTTTLEHKKEADNRFFYLSNIIKLESIGFKQAFRFVARGWFKTIKRFEGTIGEIDAYAIGSYIDALSTDATLTLKYLTRWVAVVGGSNVDLTNKIHIYNKATGEEILIPPAGANPDITYTLTFADDANAACYVFGSQDGRKFSLMGKNVRKGGFTDLGCTIEHTDMRFYRVCIAGELAGESRIDYMEISHEPSVLNGKIR